MNVPASETTFGDIDQEVDRSCPHEYMPVESNETNDDEVFECIHCEYRVRIQRGTDGP